MSRVSKDSSTDLALSPDQVTGRQETCEIPQAPM
jgi:hypothetical protein